MKNERLIAYVLIAIGAVTLLSRAGGADWLWVGGLAAAFLTAYNRRSNYGFLVAGSVLAGVAVGMLFSNQAGMLISLAVGFFMIDRVEPRPNRWPRYVAGVLAVLGVFSTLSLSGFLGSFGFALLLIAAGVYLLRRERTPRAAPRRWQTATTAAPASADAPTTAGAPQPTVASPEAVPPTSRQPTAHPTAPPTAPPTMGGGDPTTEAPAADFAAPGEAPLTPEAGARLERLEAWRRETATAEGTPAYIVFRNETLEQLAARNPQTLTAVGEIKGIGPVKLERYGEAILQVLRGDAPLQTEPAPQS